MTPTRTALLLRRVAVAALIVAMAACGTRQPAPQPSAEQLAVMAAELTRQEARLGALAMNDPQQSSIVTRVHFSRGASRPDFERLRVMRRQSTSTVNKVAAQVVLNIALIALTRGAAWQGSPQEKWDVYDIPELATDAAAVNPAIQELPDALSRVATQLYVRRALETVAEAKTDGSTLEEILSSAQIPTDFDTELLPGGWHLESENISGHDSNFRLKFGASLGRTYTGPVGCSYVSSALPWSAWQADGWQRLQEERAKALASCVERLGAHIRANW